ncbi:TPA: hypothetical protein KNG82_002184 [Escherichia coli]|nr:hypothetical protein [Escherichia coli]
MSRKLTHEEHLRDIYKVNPNVEVLGKIVNNSTKALCRCKVCDHEWPTTPNKLKHGYGCPKCYDSRRGQSQKLSHNEQVAAIAKVNPDVEVLGRIVNSDTKVLCRCKVCDHEWMVRPASIKRGDGCPKCARLRIGPKRLTHGEQVAAIAKVNHNVEVLGEITGDKTKVLCSCKVCGHEWMGIPVNLKRGQGCPKCAKYGFLSHDHGKLYIMVDDLELPTVMKVGVSVQENKRRNEVLKSARKAGVRLPDLHIVKTWEGPTDYMYEIESMLHDAFNDYRINFPVKFDGSNEFFHYRPDVFYVAQDAWLAIVANAAA